MVRLLEGAGLRVLHVEPYFTRYPTIRAACIVALAVRVPRTSGRGSSCCSSRSLADASSSPGGGRRLRPRPATGPSRRGEGVPGLLDGKNFLVWAPPTALHRLGGGPGDQASRRRASPSTYQAERLKRRVRAARRRARRRAADRAATWAATRRCAAPSTSSPHAHAGARRPGAQHRLGPRRRPTGQLRRDHARGFAQANDISSYSLIAPSREARRLMTRGGAIVTMTYAGSWRVVPTTTSWAPPRRRWRAPRATWRRTWGRRGIRVNAVSAGPMPPSRRAPSRTSAACSTCSRVTRRCAAT